MILVIDNYDSFTYNLVQYLGELGEDISVFRNDKITLEKIEEISPPKIVISPGPGTPKDAGISVPVIKHFAGRIPILGVCLGHQSIGEAFGGRVVRAERLMHGKTSLIYHDGKNGETYNIGGHNEWTNIDLIKVMCKVMDEKLDRPTGESEKLITYVTDRAGHDMRYAIDASKLKEELQ